MRRSPLPLAILGALPLFGCVLGTPADPAGTQVQLGQQGEYYYVNLFTAPLGGIITSDVGGIECGASSVSVDNGVTPPRYVYAWYPTAGGTASHCGQTRFAWSQSVTLTATARDGRVFIGWGGSCRGIGPCTLGAGADKSVVAIFALPGTAHGNYLDPAIHGPEYFSFMAGQSALRCNTCHGPTLDGLGLSPSCNACHAAAGFPAWQTSCTFCHAAPPATAAHASVTGGLTACAGCHAQSVTTAGTLVPGGKHLDGIVEATGAGHPAGYADPAQHGPDYIAFATGAGSSACSACHGADYSAPIAAGQSCNSCHAAAGFPAWQTACNFCHAAPPATATHASVTGGLTACAGCHAETVSPTGTLIAGGKHLDGVVEATGAGHAAGFAAPAVHGPEYFAFLSGTGGLACTTCHGADYASPIAAGQSCNSCHAAAGWTGWQQSCSFCHGQKSAASQAGYLLADHPTWAAPPDAVSQRLGGPAVPGRSGAHAIHLTGSSLARPFLCQTCHAVPTGPAHVSGRTARAAVNLAGAGQASLPAALGSYDPAAGTCLTACHGASASPAWSTTGLACGGCHATPPATSAHASVTGGLTACAACHPGTMNADGTVNVGGGLHVNGLVESNSPHAAGFAAAAQHGAAYLDTLGGVSGALDCASCHGAALTSCNTCHASAAGGSWVSWQTNCTFCHGTKTKTYTGNLSLADPPDAVSQRLTGVAAPTRTGRHSTHNGEACSACHAVPTSLAHVGGSTARATVTLGAYNPATGQCASACHGSERWY